MVKWVKLREQHLAMVMNWRMRPEITRGMYTDPVLTIDIQHEWFQQIKDDPTKMYWVTHRDDVPIGLVYLAKIDFPNKRCVSGGYILKEHRDFESVIANECGLLRVAFDILKLNRIQAEVMSNNMRVAQMLELEGYHVDGVLRQFIFKNGEYFDVTVLSMLKEEWEAGKMRYKYEVEMEL